MSASYYWGNNLVPCRLAPRAPSPPSLQHRAGFPGWGVGTKTPFRDQGFFCFLLLANLAVGSQGWWAAGRGSFQFWYENQKRGRWLIHKKAGWFFTLRRGIFLKSQYWNTDPAGFMVRGRLPRGQVPEGPMMDSQHLVPARRGTPVCRWRENPRFSCTLPASPLRGRV